MKFGKQLQTETLPEWREFYMNYRRLKRAIKRMQIEKEAGQAEAQDAAPESRGLLEQQKAAEALTRDRNAFDDELDKEIDKVETFFNSKLTQCTEEFAKLMQQLRLGGGDEYGTSYGRRKSEALFRYYKTSNDESPDEAILRLYQTLSELETFAELNRTGFRKILKKYDKNMKENKLPAVMEHIDRDLKFGTSMEKIHRLMQDTNLLYRTATNDTSASCKAVLASRAKVPGFFDVPWTCKWTWVFVAVACFFVLMVIPFFDPDHQRAQRCLAMLVFVTILWVTEAVPYFVTSLWIPILTVVLNLSTSKSGHDLEANKAVDFVLSKIFNHTVALIIGGFSISTAFSKYGFEMMMASFLVKRLKHYPRLFMLAIMFVCAFLSMWISNVAAPLLCASIVIPIIHDLPEDSRFIRALLLGLAFAGNVGGMLTPIASPQNAIALGVYNNFVENVGDEGIGQQITFIQWIAVATPNGLLILLIGWLFLLVVMKPNDVDLIPDVLFTPQKFHLFHYICIFGSLATIVLWCTLSFTRHIFGDMGFIALFPLVLFLSTGVLTKHDFRERFAWDLVFLVGGGNVLGAAIKSSSLLKLISDPISGILREADLTAWVTMVAFSLFAVFVCTFVSHTVGAIILTPIIVEIASTLGMSECKQIVMAASIMYSAAGALPMSSFPNINSLMVEDENERKYLKPMDFIKYGGGMTIIGFVTTISFGYLIMIELF